MNRLAYLLCILLTTVPVTAQSVRMVLPVGCSEYSGTSTDFQHGYSVLYRDQYTDTHLNYYEGIGSHPGVDITRDNNGQHFTTNTPVYAICDGIVTRVTVYGKSDNGWGNSIVLRHNVSGLGIIFSAYAHMDRFTKTFSVGDEVSTETQIGFVGSTGRSTGVHLHFQIDNDVPASHPFFPNRFPGSSDAELEVNTQDNDGYVANRTFSPLTVVQSRLTPLSFWQATNGPNVGDGISAMAINSQGLIFAASGGSGIYRSSDRGQNWVPKNSGLANSGFVSALAINSSNHLFAGTHLSGGVFRSTDNGENWTLVGLSGTYINNITTSGNTIFATDGHNCSGVYRSTDDGNTWAQVNNGINTCTNGIAINPSGVVFAGSGLSGMYRSLDNGVSWQQSGLSSFAINQVVASGTAVYAGTTTNIYSGQIGQEIFKSTNNGDTWVQIANGFTSNAVGWIAATSSGYLLATGYTAQDVGSATNPFVFRSTNGGASWQTVTSGLPSPAWAGPVAIAPDGYAYTSVGTTVYKSLQPAIGVYPKAAMSQEIIHEFRLDQNFPNPFNPTTDIYYSIPAEAKVELNIYNVLGQKVVNLVDEIQSAGTKKVVFDASQLPSGLYFYQLQAGKYFEIKKMVLVK